MQWMYLLLIIQTIAGMAMGAFILYNWTSLFYKIKNTRFKKAITLFLLVTSFYIAIIPLNFGWDKLSRHYLHPVFIIGALLYEYILAFTTLTIVQFIQKQPYFNRLSVLKKDSYSFLIISIVPMLIELPLAFVLSKAKVLDLTGPNLIENISFTLFYSSFAAVLYLLYESHTRKKEATMQQKELALAKLKQLKTESDLAALHAKINPHFLYNALNSIAGLAMEDGFKTSKMAVALSKLFRYSLNKETNNWATVQEEIEMVETYLSIEKIRFEDRLHYTIAVGAGCATLKIPKFILQPIVENAILHGFKGAYHKGILTLSFEKEEQYLVIKCIDNGSPFTEDMQLGYGLKSLYEKMDLLLPNAYEISMENTPVKQLVIKQTIPA
jgi:two-component system, LytTR family, sensor kinase